MKLRLAVVFTVLVVAVAGFVGQADSASAQGVFRVTFRASGKALNQYNQETDLRITEGSIVASAVSAHGFAPRAARNYVLVYNTTNDALQVVKNVDGTVLSDVIQFEGGAATTDQRLATRFTFMFLPNETTAFGSAFISEKWPGILIGDDNDRGNLTARMQFSLTGNDKLGGTNGVPVAGTNTNSITITNNPGTTNGTTGDTNGLALADSGNTATNGGGLGTSLNPITETNSLSLGSPAFPPNTSNGTTATNGGGSLMSSTALSVEPAASAITRMNPVAAGSSPGMFLTTASLGGTNAANVRVFTGTFMVGRRFLPNGANSPMIQSPPVSIVDTNTSGTTNTAVP